MFLRPRRRRTIRSFEDNDRFFDFLFGFVVFMVLILLAFTASLVYSALTLGPSGLGSMMGQFIKALRDAS